MKKLVLIVVLSLLVMAFVVPAVSAAPSESGGYWYYVRYGDTLYSISRYTGVSTHAIINANGIHNPNWIYAGTSLWIPSYHPAPAPGCHYDCGYHGHGYHTVRYGETLLGIGRYYGVSAWSIARANGIYNMNYIYAGQVLHIP